MLDQLRLFVCFTLRTVQHTLATVKTHGHAIDIRRDIQNILVSLDKFNLRLQINPVRFNHYTPIKTFKCMFLEHRRT